MDRDVIYAVIVAVFGTALVGSFYFDGSPKQSALSTAENPVPAEERIYAPEDIRYALQQKELRERAKKRKVVRAPSANAASEDEGSGDQGLTDHPSVMDHPPVGEPDIE